MLSKHYEYRAKLDSLQNQIRATSPQARVDLLKMWRSCDNLFQALDSELVNCRRRNRLSAKYTTLQEQLDNIILSLEKRIMWAGLL